MTESFTKKQTVIKDLLLSYYTKGGGERSILFLHGWGSQSTLWFPSIQSTDFANTSLYFLDLPGFGESQAPQTAYTLDDYIAVVDTFIKKQKIEKVVLVGHSFGGRIAIKLASQSPSYLTSLILVDSAGLDHRSRDTSIKIGFAKLVAPLFKPSFMQPLRKKLYALIGSDDYVASQYIKDTFINIVNESLDQYLPLISTRTLIIWGEQDDNSYTPPSDAQVMQEKIAKSQVVILPGAGHYSFMDRPKEFAEALTNFLKKP